MQCRELLHKFAEESKLAVRALFSQARACTPCILFFDEVSTTFSFVHLHFFEEKKEITRQILF